jgi:translocator protein
MSEFDWAQVHYVAPVIGVVVAVAGGLLTDVGPWYKALKMPNWKPPDWAFGPIWTVIFVLAVIACVQVWRLADSPQAKQAIALSYGVNCVVNIAWSALYFKLKRPDWALIESVFLWASIVWMIVVSYPISATAALLLAPYLIWVSIATVLNWSTVKLNQPFV